MPKLSSFLEDFGLPALIAFSVLALIIVVFITILIWIKTTQLLAAQQKLKDAEEEFNNKVAVGRVNTEMQLNALMENGLNDLGRKMQEKEKELLRSYAEEVKNITDKMNSYERDRKKEVSQQLFEFHSSELQKYVDERNRKIAEEESRLERILIQKTQEHTQNMQKLEESLNILRSREGAARNTRIENYEDVNANDIYRINISEQDAVEIGKIEEVVHLFRNPIPLRKAVFDIYYKEPLKDLINIHTKGKRVTGIYKITHIESGKCYIGQSVDIGNRWMQHCKRGCGADSLTGSKLYPEMLKYGIDKFYFEVVEEVSESQLSAAEKHWSDFYGAKIFGYSIKN